MLTSLHDFFIQRACRAMEALVSGVVMDEFCYVARKGVDQCIRRVLSGCFLPIPSSPLFKGGRADKPKNKQNKKEYDL